MRVGTLIEEIFKCQNLQDLQLPAQTAAIRPPLASCFFNISPTFCDWNEMLKNVSTSIFVGLLNDLYGSLFHILHGMYIQ